MKKLLSMILTLTLVAALFTGCSSSSSSESSKDDATPTAAASGDTASEEVAEPTEEAAASVINFDEDPYEVNIQFVGLFEENKDIAAVEEAINAITLPAINATVNIVPIFIGDLPTTTSLAIAGGEKMDVVVVGLTQTLSSMVPDGLLLELDDLLTERGADVSAVTADVVEAETINGHIYAVSGYPYAANSSGFVYNKTMADALGIKMFDGMTYDDLTATAEILKANNTYLTTFGNSSELNYKFFETVESYGNAGVYGAIMDPTNSTTIENIYESAGFENYCNVVKSWADAGYLPSDQLTDSTAVQEYFKQQKIFGTSTHYTVEQIAAWVSPDFETGIVKMTDPIISTSGAVEFMLGIASNCERPDKAMDLINLIYANADVANLIQSGVEGTDYVRVEGTQNVITTAGTANEDHNGYFSAFSHYGDPLKRLIPSPLTDSFYDDLVSFNASAKKSLSFGYTFDASEYSAEAGAISNVIAEYLPLLNAGLAPDTAKQLADFQAALKDAGIDDVISANQAQLDAYIAQ